MRNVPLWQIFFRTVVVGSALLIVLDWIRGGFTGINRHGPTVLFPSPLISFYLLPTNML